MREIMVVDDELDILEFVIDLLGGEGYAIQPFSDGQAALEHARLHPPALALVDLNMPLMSGRELILCLRAQPGGDFPILAMSASVGIERVQDLPIQGYLPKPFDLGDLIARIRCLIAESMPVPAPGTSLDLFSA